MKFLGLFSRGRGKGGERPEVAALGAGEPAARGHFDALFAQPQPIEDAVAAPAPVVESQVSPQAAQTGQIVDEPAPHEAASPPTEAILVEAARLAEEQGALLTAEACWAAVRAQYPQSVAGWIGGCALAMRLQQHGRASALLEEARRCFAGEAALSILSARHEAAAKLWQKAASYWWEALDAPGAEPALFLEAARSLRGAKMGRRERAGAVLEVLGALARDFPDYREADALQVSARLDAGDEAGALDVGQRLIGAAPEDATLAIACAEAALACGKTGLQLAILKAARERAEPSAELDAASIQALSQAGKVARAEELSAVSLKRFPGNGRVIEQYVGIAMRAGDMGEAARRAVFWRDLYPENRAVTRLAERLTLPDSGVRAGGAEAAGQKPLAGLFSRFESLGALKGGCEFGFIQSMFGAETISLMRWANMGADGLIKALGCRFEGLGQPEHTRIKTRAVGGGEEEYFLFDDRFGYVAHTFMKTHEAPQDQVFVQTLRRIRFMREKLLEDLALAEKIFVFKFNTVPAVEQVLALYSGVAEYGAITLLCVTLADEAHAGGTVEMLQPGLFLGRVDSLGGAGMIRGKGIDGESWQSICEQVAAWHDSRTG